ncbi:hypothetical protein C9374_003585 [Naegleria lovaniensis]|uniref:Uncharacterized protein n=1 Tax=Naegleria lovaniensis TaxID=51637 RepID=A0AA88H7E3_NAELO|nr:uncharacterized protein C9374_003585 [Naegleria lovaniensis]KAG2393821.1 hypothetical protein C9374_003585 [Naegleria lovaniensis]
MSHSPPPSYDVAASSPTSQSNRLSTTLTPQDIQPTISGMPSITPLGLSPSYAPAIMTGVPNVIEMAAMTLGQTCSTPGSVSSNRNSMVVPPPLVPSTLSTTSTPSSNRNSVVIPPPSTSVVVTPSSNRNSVVIPTSSSPPSNNRHSWQIAGDALEPLRAHSPREDVRSHLSSNRNSVALPTPPIEEKVKPPSYSQSHFDDTSATATKNIYQAATGSTTNSDRQQPIISNSDLKTDFSPPPAVTPIPNFHFVNSPAMNNNQNTLPEQIPDKLANSTSPRKIQDKSTLSKTIWGCCGLFCISPMLCLLCCFSVIELIAIIVFQYISTHNLDPTSTSEDSSIFSMVLVAQIATFAAVILCCVASSLMATSAMCDNSLSRVETKNRFVIAMITVIIGIIFIMLLMLRGGLEGYTTKVLIERIQPGFTNYMSALTTQFNFIPSALVVLMFALCVLTVAVCGLVGFCCVCWFCCCSTNLFIKQLRQDKKQKMETP